MNRLQRAEPKPDYCLYLVFRDGTEGLISVKDLLWGAMFEPMKDPSCFNQVFVDESGILNWPNGADIAPAELYKRVNNADRQQ